MRCDVNVSEMYIVHFSPVVPLTCTGDILTAFNRVLIYIYINIFLLAVSTRIRVYKYRHSAMYLSVFL